MEEKRQPPFADVYRIREELSQEYLALSPEERARRINELMRQLSTQYHFRFAPPPAQVQIRPQA